MVLSVFVWIVSIKDAKSSDRDSAICSGLFLAVVGRDGLYELGLRCLDKTASQSLKSGLRGRFLGT